MKAILLPLLAAATAVAPASAQGGPPLTMTCHLLYRGQPSPEATVYTLVGNTLSSTQSGRTTRLSRAGAPIPLGRSVDRGVVTQSFADHTRRGPVVTRRVYWKEGAAPRRLRFTETYDFTRQTVTIPGEGDSCHHAGR